MSWLTSVVPKQVILQQHTCLVRYICRRIGELRFEVASPWRGLDRDRVNSCAGRRHYWLVMVVEFQGAEEVEQHNSSEPITPLSGPQIQNPSSSHTLPSGNLEDSVHQLNSRIAYLVGNLQENRREAKVSSLAYLQIHGNRKVAKEAFWGTGESDGGVTLPSSGTPVSLPGAGSYMSSPK